MRRRTILGWAAGGAFAASIAATSPLLAGTVERRQTPGVIPVGIVAPPPPPPPLNGDLRKAEKQDDRFWVEVQTNFAEGRPRMLDKMRVRSYYGTAVDGNEVDDVEVEERFGAPAFKHRPSGWWTRRIYLNIKQVTDKPIVIVATGMDRNGVEQSLPADF